MIERDKRYTDHMNKGLELKGGEEDTEDDVGVRLQSTSSLPPGREWSKGLSTE